MAKTSKAPVKPIGRILYSEIYTWSPYGLGGESKYDRVCECKGYSDDRPFSVFLHKDPEDKSPWKVCYHWRNEDGYKQKTVNIFGRPEQRTDEDTYHMTDILQAHASKTAAQKVMRELGTKSVRRIRGSMMEACESIPDITIMGKKVNEIHLLVTFNGFTLTLRDTWDVVQNRIPIYMNGAERWSASHHPWDKQSLRDFTDIIVNAFKVGAPDHIPLTASKSHSILVSENVKHS